MENKLAQTVRSSESLDVRDKFCYYCHEKSLKISCSKCFRSYHDKCLKVNAKNCRINTSTNTIECAICSALEMEAATSHGQQESLDLLKYTMAKVLSVSDFKVLQYMVDWKKQSKHHNAVVNPIDLAVCKKVDGRIYDSFYAFTNDLQNIFHNCFVYYSERHEFTENAKKLLEFGQSEVNSILSCAECYRNKYTRPDKWRTMACGKPHLLLWAKLNRSTDFWPAKKGYSHWPAKLISVFENDIKVVFFDHTEFNVIPSKQCSLYSIDVPSLSNINVDADDIKAALQELELYAANVKKKHGEVNKRLPHTRFDNNKFDDHHKAMFPNYNENHFVATTSGDSVDEPVIAKKRPRIAIDALTTSDVETTPTSASDVETPPVPESSLDGDSLIWGHLHCKQLLEESVKTMSTDMLSIIDNSLTKLLNVNKQKLSESSQAIRAAAHLAKNNELIEQLKAIRLDRDNLRRLLIKANEQLRETQPKQQHGEKNGQFVDQIEKDLNEANRLVAKMITDKDAALTDAKLEHEHQMDELKIKFRAQHCAAVLKTELKFEKERNRIVNDLRKSHRIELDLEKKWAIDEIDKMTREHNEIVTEMKRQIQAAADEKASLENKYQGIVVGIKNTERARLLDENRGRIYCICGKVFNHKFFCSTECVKMWNIYKAQNKVTKPDE
ncbi:zinc finger MYND domain-containing protein 11-like isoform X2 [Contarinia nasturtii]|uniref:zinc finger MYND domain-containing protein 11-like isoform X2 n=1 Tax=Contarinia nasturtii TaxID=265458 RepID=UPI0012D41403|nr:zinc finger MYND domain-containing protein 11-like isoform X2 [Contarinia nasturtii]